MTAQQQCVGVRDVCTDFETLPLKTVQTAGRNGVVGFNAIHKKCVAVTEPALCVIR